MPTFSLTRRVALAWMVAASFTFVSAPRVTFAQTAPQPLLADADSTAIEPDSPDEPSIRFSGVGFFDYSYTVASPVEEAAGANSFNYRRLYLTMDYTLSDDFSGRLRFEARSNSTTEEGRPAPFVKDAYLEWAGPLAEGHDLRFGLQPPPLFEIVERVWGYRSLDRTLVDRARANSSRDVGLRADGPLATNVSYSLMVANGRGLRQEQEFSRGKHVYGQVVATPTPTTRAALALDYTPHEGDDESRDESIKATVFLGSDGESVRLGVEGFAIHTSYVDSREDSDQGLGASVFGVYSFGARGEYRAIGRYDFVQGGARRTDADEHYVLAAFAYAPIPRVEIMPNVLFSRFDGADALVTARLTIAAQF